MFSFKIEKYPLKSLRIILNVLIYMVVVTLCCVYYFRLDPFLPFALMFVLYPLVTQSMAIDRILYIERKRRRMRGLSKDMVEK